MTGLFCPITDFLQAMPRVKDSLSMPAVMFFGVEVGRLLSRGIVARVRVRDSAEGLASCEGSYSGISYHRQYEQILNVGLSSSLIFVKEFYFL